MVSKIADMRVPIKSSKKTKERNRKRSEKKLLASQKFTRSIIDNSLDMICATDKNARIMEFNKTALQGFGYKPDEILGKSPRVLYANLKEALAINDQLNSSGGYTGEVTYKRKNGEEFIAYLSASVLKDEKENIVGTMSISRDITAQKKEEELLRMSEGRYRDLFENAIDLIQSINTKGEILYVNNAWKKTLGYINKQIIGKSIFEFIHPDDLKHCTNQFKQIMSGKQLEVFEIAFITRKGKKIIAEGNVNCKFMNSKPVSTRGIFRDVTKSKEIERAIRESEERYRAIYDYANIGISRVNLDGKFINVNRQFCEIMGYSEEELYKMQFKDLTYPDDLKKSMKFKRDLLKEKHSNTSIEKKYVHKNGSIIYANLTVTLVRDQNGDPDYFVSVTEDITEKKKAEELLKKSLQEKEILLKEIHHRVKNNLQIISSMLSLQSSSITDKNAINILKDSQNRVKSMAQIYENLYQAKDLARINFSNYIFDLSKELIHSYLIYDKLVELKHDIAKVFLNLDLAISCGLIINELVSNSLKYAFPRTKKGILHIGLEKKNRLIKLTIGDNGIGLPDGLDFRNSKTLGLQLVILLVKQIKGTIDINSKSGTKYTITFKTTI